MAKAPTEKKKVTVETFDLKSFVVGIIRASFKKTPMFHAARDAAKVMVELPTKTGKMVPRIHYRCAHCGGLFRDKGVEEYVDDGGEVKKRRFRGEIAVDHIDPVVPVTGWDSFDGFVLRHFFGKLQVLCNYSGKENIKKHGRPSCHAIKTKEENRLRREHAKGSK